MEAQITFKTESGEIKLVRQDLVEGKISMRLPESLQDLSKDIERTDQGNPIERSMSNKEKTVLLTLARTVLDDKHTEMPEEKYIDMATTGYRQVLSRVAPGYKEIGVFTRNVNGHTIGCINYFMHGRETEKYNVFASFRSGHDLYQCNFTCQDKDAEVWNLIFLACIDSLEIVEE